MPLGSIIKLINICVFINLLVMSSNNERYVFLVLKFALNYYLKGGVVWPSCRPGENIPAYIFHWWPISGNGKFLNKFDLKLNKIFLKRIP